MIKIRTMKKYSRILILGSPGSGKTTLALELGKILGYPTFHLDYFFRVRDEKDVDLDYVYSKSEELVSKDEWIIEGNYMKSLDIRLKRANFIVFMDLPSSLCLKQAYHRFNETKGKERFDAPKGMIDYKFDKEFQHYIRDFKKIYQPPLYQKAIKESGIAHIVLCNHEDIEKFKKKVESWR